MKKIHPEDLKPALERINAFRRKRGKLNHEFRFQKKDGSYIYVEENGIHFPDENGNSHRVLGIMNDITEKKEAEEALAKIEEVRKKRDSPQD
ncbi:PAS domain-containing protein [Methanosarcina horonobensis]|uniref:PAS domain-containing protein n=1 Tax=Methanosarcina horonobensis TaxID=418008 RepID=UPI0022B909F0|nr:PAS domain-containing protein [Methanosarcina horonobensis]